VARSILDRQPQDTGAVFPADVAQLICWTKLEGAGGASIHHVWFHGDTQVGDVELSGGWVALAHLEPQDGAGRVDRSLHVEVKDAAGRGAEETRLYGRAIVVPRRYDATLYAPRAWARAT